MSINPPIDNDKSFPYTAQQNRFRSRQALHYVPSGCMHLMQNLIFAYINYDKCLKEIVALEKKKASHNSIPVPIKEYQQESLDLLKCHSNK